MAWFEKILIWPSEFEIDGERRFATLERNRPRRRREGSEYRLQGHEASEKEELKEHVKATQLSEAGDKASSTDKSD